MYYFIPKQADRPVYSYKLSIIHFWSLIFLYIWAGPHHLHYTALPDWAQTLGMVMSIILWMPSWGGMINGLMTLQGAWDKLRTDPILRMLVVVGRLLRHGDLRGADDVDPLGQLAQPLHRLDDRPRAFRRARLERHDHLRRALLPGAAAVEARAGSTRSRLVSWHFWLATIGIVLYAASMWVGGIMQGLMWREVDDQGFLVNTFVDTVVAMHPMYVDPRARRGALPRGRAHHGLEPLEDGRRRAAAGPARAGRVGTRSRCQTATETRSPTLRLPRRSRSSCRTTAGSSATTPRRDQRDAAAGALASSW